MKFFQAIIFFSFVLLSIQANAEVYVVDINGGEIQKVGELRYELGSIDLNQSGDLLLLNAKKDDRDVVFLMKSNGKKKAKQLSPDFTHDMLHPIFAPDQQNIIYGEPTGPGRPPQIFLIDQKWENKKLLTITTVRLNERVNR